MMDSGLRLRLSRADWLFVMFALVIAAIITRGLVTYPTFTDAYYHFNVAQRIAEGEGYTDSYLWIYIGAPDTLPDSGIFPSHLYWMPLTSSLAGVSMWLFNDPGNYSLAQIPFTLMFAGIALVAYWLGARLGNTTRHRWMAGLLVLFSGFFTRWWGEIDTFAPYGLVASLALIFIGLTVDAESKKRQSLGCALIAGVFVGLGHLTRADGLLLLFIGWLSIGWGIWREPQLKRRLQSVAVLTLGYVLVMSPWFIRNLDVVGSPLPLGGTQAIWLSEYNELFNYPPESTIDAFFVDGISTLVNSRVEAFANNLGTFIAVQGLVMLTPLMLLGMWNRRRQSFLRGFIWYALGLHVVMTIVFPFPGYRGGLFHSASALMPFWAILGLLGLDDVIEWIAKRRRNWKPRTAKPVFSGGLILLAIVLSWQFGLSELFVSRSSSTPAIYQELDSQLPEDARIMINDPAALYYFTGRGGVVTPNALPEMIPEIAERYAVDYLLVNVIEREAGNEINIPAMLAFDFDDPPEFLREVSINTPNMRLYEIITD